MSKTKTPKSKAMRPYRIAPDEVLSLNEIRVRQDEYATEQKRGRAEALKLKRLRHPMLKQAAIDMLAVGEKYGIDFKIFGCAFMSKVPFRYTNGSSDAVGLDKSVDPSLATATANALRPWTQRVWNKKKKQYTNAFKYLGANPCVRLDDSGLVAIDIDHGLEGLDTKQMLEKIDRYFGEPTYTVKTGRLEGGSYLLYQGSRIAKDCTGDYGFDLLPLPGYTVGLSGCIKHHGHVAIPGAIHSTGNTYECIRETFGQLPKWWAEYHNKGGNAGSETENKFRKDWKKRAEGPDPLAAQEIEYMEKHRAKLLSGEDVIVRDKEIIQKGNKRRFKFCLRQAGIMRKQSLPPELIRIALDRCVAKSCEDWKDFVLSHSDSLDTIAGWSAEWKKGDIVVSGKGLTTVKGPDGKSMVIVTPAKVTRHDILVKTMKTWGPEIAATEGYDLLTLALVGSAFTLRRDATGRRAVKAARDETTYTAKCQGNGVWMWVLSSPESLSSQTQKADAVKGVSAGS